VYSLLKCKLTIIKGYHVQITARSDRDLTPEGITQKVADSSGSRYTGATKPSESAPKPAIASKPVFTPSKVTGSSGFNPLGSRVRVLPQTSGNIDKDGWGEDAPPVTRTQLEKVAPAYRPTKVKLAEFGGQNEEQSSAPEVVRGAYQPIGKVDIAEIRRQARDSGSGQDDRPAAVKGAYEPVGKVDIAAIRSRAQPQRESAPEPTEEPEEEVKSLADRSSAFSQPERLTSLPKPKVASKFGGGAFSSGTTAPVPGGFTAKTNPTAAPVGTASRTFADQGGKTPAQIWAEKKAAQGGGGSFTSTSSTPIQSQTSGQGGWKSGYSGKSWAAVQTTKTGQSIGSNPNEQETQHEEEEEEAPSANVGAIRDRFAAAPPPVNLASRPVPTPAHEEEEEEEEEREPSRPISPIRVALPVRRAAEPEPEPEPEQEEEHHPAPSGGKGGKRALVQYDYEKAEDNEIELKEGEYVTNIEQVDPDWWMGQNAAGETGLFPANYVGPAEDDEEEEEHHAVASHPPPPARAEHSPPPAASRAPPAEKKPTATAQYDYEAAEDNELSFPEGGTVHNLVSFELMHLTLTLLTIF
jgi:hypothetical protein